MTPYTASDGNAVSQPCAFTPRGWGIDAPPLTEVGDSVWAGKQHEARLLVVDDDDVDRERISRYIKKFRLPIAILDASSGSEAMRCIAQDEIDLILLDYNLGDMTGTELLTHINQPGQTVIPTIMVTGMGDERTAVEALRLGVVDYVPKKSLTAESLLSVIESALHSSELERQLHETQQNLRRMSLYDELTGLPNRNLFFDRLNQNILGHARSGDQFTLMMLDLNLFKEVNDTLGHAAGDHVLSVVGERLQGVVRQSDTFARLGGDEFVCILHGMHQRSDAIECAEKIITAISQPIAIADRVIQIGAAIGIVRYPVHGQDATTLLSNADSIMYKAKQAHRKYLCLEDLEESSVNHMPVSQHLYQALRKHELYLEYQPKVTSDSHQFVGIEALVRWNSPDLGQVSPAEFIPVAERSHLIVDLTYYVMEMAFTQLRHWRSEGMNLYLAINISARMLDDETFTHRTRRLLDQHGLQAADLIFEITETTLAASDQQAHKILNELIDLGIGISIDDFGSGFTSFRHLRNIAFSELKIDRIYTHSLQSGSRDAEIIRSMVLLAEGLNMRVVAEGVETTEQLALLNQLGCHLCQGYLIARPMDAAALIQWLKGTQTHH